MDASSGAVVKALDPQPGDNILDLCCAPGAKLCMISDVMGRTGTVTGVDINLKRLGSCRYPNSCVCWSNLPRTLCNKYAIPNCRLFLEDACKFNFLAPGRSSEVRLDHIRSIFAHEPQDLEDTLPPFKKLKIESFATDKCEANEVKVGECEEKREIKGEVKDTYSDTKLQAGEKPKTRKRKRKGKKGDLKNLFYSAHWTYRSSSKKLYDKV